MVIVLEFQCYLEYYCFLLSTECDWSIPPASRHSQGALLPPFVPRPPGRPPPLPGGEAVIMIDALRARIGVPGSHRPPG